MIIILYTFTATFRSCSASNLFRTGFSTSSSTMVVSSYSATIDGWSWTPSVSLFSDATIDASGVLVRASDAHTSCSLMSGAAAGRAFQGFLFDLRRGFSWKRIGYSTQVEQDRLTCNLGVLMCVPSSVSKPATKQSGSLIASARTACRSCKGFNRRIIH